MGSFWKALIAAAIVTVPFAANATDIEGWMYSRAGVAVYQPDSTPAPSGKCESCNGTGRVGDGRVFTDCLDCGGDGVIGSSGACACDPCVCEDCQCGSLNLVSAPVQYESVCEDGVCRLVPVTGERVAGAVESVVVASGSAIRGDCGDRRLPGRLIQRIRENKPVRSFARRLLGR